MKTKHSHNLSHGPSLLSRRIIPIGIVTAAAVIGIVTISISKADNTTKPVSIQGNDPVAIGCTKRVWSTGSTGPCVLIIQSIINDSYPGSLTANGQYTGKTQAAVKRWQAQKQTTYPNIETDGVVGPQTWSAILWNK